VAEVDGVEPDAEAVRLGVALDAVADALAEGLADELDVVVRLATTVTLSPGVPRSWAS